MDARLIRTALAALLLLVGRPAIAAGPIVSSFQAPLSTTLGGCGVFASCGIHTVAGSTDPLFQLDYSTGTGQVSVGVSGAVGAYRKFYVQQVDTSPTVSGETTGHAAIESRQDYQPTADTAANPDGVYGTLWYDSAHHFTGAGAAVRGNAYTIDQGGSGVHVDVDTLVGVYGRARQEGGGTVIDAIGLYADAFQQGTSHGTATRAEGIYIVPNTLASNNYGIYFAGANAGGDIRMADGVTLTLKTASSPIILSNSGGSAQLTSTGGFDVSGPGNLQAVSGNIVATSGNVQVSGNVNVGANITFGPTQNLAIIKSPSDGVVRFANNGQTNTVDFTVGAANALSVNGAFSATSFAGAGTGLTGTASGLTAGAVTTNANLTGDTTSVGNATTTVKVNGVSYGTSPGTNTVPVVTSSNTVTYEAVPNAALANSSVTIAGHAVSLGGTQTIACADLSNGATGCSTATGTSGATIPLLNGVNTWSAAQSINSGDLVLKGATSGATTLNAAATAGTTTITLPGGTTDFSGTGGTSQVVKQVSTGAAFTVARLACADLSDAGAGCTGAAAPTAANPTATIGTAAVNGSAATFMRSDGAPALPATLNVVTALQLNGVLLNSSAAPTISSGCGTGSPSISANNGNAAFEVTLGNSAATCVIGLPTAAHGWNCYASDITTTTATAFLTKQTASSTTSCTLANFTTAGASGNWANADKLRVIARAY